MHNNYNSNNYRGRGRGGGRGGVARGGGGGTGRGNRGGGGYRGYRRSPPRYNRYGASDNGNSQYRDSSRDNSRDNSNEHYGDPRSTNYTDYRQQQQQGGYSPDNSYDRSRQDFRQEQQRDGGGYQQQNYGQQSYQGAVMMQPVQMMNGQPNSAQNLPLSPPYQYQSTFSPIYGQNGYDGGGGAYASNGYVDQYYVQSAQSYEWNEEAADPQIDAGHPPRPPSYEVPVAYSQNAQNNRNYTSLTPDSMSRSGEDSRSSPGGYNTENGSDDARYSPNTYRNPALDFEMSRNDPYAPPGGYLRLGESMFSRKYYPGSVSNDNSYNTGYSDHAYANRYYTNSYNNGPVERSTAAVSPDTVHVRTSSSQDTVTPRAASSQDTVSPRASPAQEAVAVRVEETREQRKEETQRKVEKIDAQKKENLKTSAAKILKEAMIGAEKRRFYDDWGEIKGPLVFVRGGQGVNVCQSSPDDMDDEGNYIAPVLHNPLKAPRGWFPVESKVESLFKNDQLNVANLQIVQEKACIVVGETTAKRFDSWEDSGLHQHLVSVLVGKCGFSKPRPIQISAVSEIMAGKNIVAQSVTGSGKTLAFVLPIVDKILKMGRSVLRGNSCRKPIAVVVQPTRELALQVHDAFRRVTDGTDIRCTLAFGQMDKVKIVSSLFKGVDIYVGTTGRLLDLVEHREVYFDRLQFFVIDEADRFLNSKEIDHLRSVVRTKEFKKTDERRQTLVFSATLNQDCVQIARSIMQKDYVSIKNNDTKANRLVKQVYIEGKGKLAKNALLKQIFDKDKKEKVVVKTLIFVDTKKQSDFLAYELINMQYSAHSINGDRPQNVRDEIYHKFLDGQISILVGTDVCSRGWDIPNLQRVINYDLPQLNENETMENLVDKFIHRIGRTGRIKEGTAITFVDPRMDKEISRDLVEICREVGQEPPTFLLELAGEPYHVDAFAPPAGFVEGEAPKWSDFVKDGSGDQKKEDDVVLEEQQKVEVVEEETPILGGGSSDEEVYDEEEEEKGGRRRRLNTVQEEEGSDDGVESEGDDDVMEESHLEQPSESDVTVTATKD